MSTNADSYTLDEAVTIRLDHHRAEQFRDILSRIHGDMPTLHTYTVPSATDVDTRADLDEAEKISAEGMKTEAWIGFDGQVAEVHLNPNYYADTPADELQNEAQRVLLDWAQSQRQRLQIQRDPLTGQEHRDIPSPRAEDTVPDTPEADRDH
jgi:hypothetical protein